MSSLACVDSRIPTCYNNKSIYKMDTLGSQDNESPKIRSFTA